MHTPRYHSRGVRARVVASSGRAVCSARGPQQGGFSYLHYMGRRRRGREGSVLQGPGKGGSPTRTTWVGGVGGEKDPSSSDRARGVPLLALHE